MAKILREEIMAILDAQAPRLPKKTKKLITWEIFVTINQTKLWQDQDHADGALGAHEQKDKE